MAKHLGTDEFLVSNLVGAAVAGIAFGDALQLCQMPSTPNLYWAFATLPNTLDDLPVPAPVDPLTGKPFQYELIGDKAILTGHRLPGLQYRLVIRFAK